MKKLDIPFGRPWIANEDRKAVMNVLKVTRLHLVLEVYDDEDPAVKAFN